MSPNQPSFSSLLKIYVFLIACLVSTTTFAQLTTTEFVIDSMVVLVDNKEVELKHIYDDDYEARVPFDYGVYVFIFNSKTQQVVSQIRYQPNKYWSQKSESYFGTKSHNSKMRPELFYMCYGVFDGAYELIGKESGSFKNEQLHGKLTINETGRYGWYGTAEYIDGDKFGKEICKNGDVTYEREFESDYEVRTKKYSNDSILLRYEIHSPVHKLYEYDNSGNAIRIMVPDSIHLYYENNILSYSLTFNVKKNIWESRSFYPSGELERYRPHTNYNFSPLSGNQWYDENGKPKADPGPSLEVEHDNYTQTLYSVAAQKRSVVPDKDIFSLYDYKDACKAYIDSALSVGLIKIKKKNTGSLNFELEVGKYKTLSLSFLSSPQKDPTVLQHIKITLEALKSENIPAKSISNYPITYLKSTVGVLVAKP
jgi:hypothetical protein